MLYLSFHCPAIILEIKSACTTCCNCVGCKGQGGKATDYKDDRDGHNLVLKKNRTLERCLRML